MKKRTRQFALRVIHLCELLPQSRTGNIITSQLLRAGTSIGANIRAACLARSSRDSVRKLGIVVEEIDESAYWIELIVEARLMPERRVVCLWKEAGELTAFFVAAYKTASQNLQKIENRK